MGVRHIKTDLRARRESKEREAAVQSAALSASVFVFRHMAAAGEIDNNVILAHAALFDRWDKDADPTLDKGAIAIDDGRLYKRLEAPDPKVRGTPKPPSKAADKWAEIGVVSL